jgi:aminoglycoside phosphotransferase (APT) family kinase protein
VTLVAIDDGYDFHVVVIDDAWVFRFARRPGVVQALEQEVELLPLLAPALPVGVPRFTHVSHEPPYVVYPLIRGTPLVDDDPQGVKAFLEALHSLDPASLPLRALAWIDEYVDRCERFARDVLLLLDSDVQGRARDLLAAAQTLTGFEPVPIHGDVLPEHLLCNDGRLVGVIDWGDACVGDPALDYAWLLNEPFPDWDVDDELRRRAHFYHRLEPWVWAHNGLMTQRPERVHAGLAEISSRL